ncbi:hypothetical protein U1Q18_000103 [Sarracenia purpurea var. burkii]
MWRVSLAFQMSFSRLGSPVAPIGLVWACRFCDQICPDPSWIPLHRSVWYWCAYASPLKAYRALWNLLSAEWAAPGVDAAGERSAMVGLATP